jgi:hypothetical protein
MVIGEYAERINTSRKTRGDALGLLIRGLDFLSIDIDGM